MFSFSQNKNLTMTTKALFHLMSWNNDTFWGQILSLYSRPESFYLLWSYTAWRKSGYQHQGQSPLRQLGGGQQAPVTTSQSSMQSPTQTLSCSEGTHLTGITHEGTRAAASPHGLYMIYWACVQRNSGFVCIPIPTTFHSDPFESISLIGFGPYIHTCKQVEGSRSLCVRAKHLHSFSLRI